VSAAAAAAAAAATSYYQLPYDTVVSRPRLNSKAWHFSREDTNKVYCMTEEVHFHYIFPVQLVAVVLVIGSCGSVLKTTYGASRQSFLIVEADKTAGPGRKAGRQRGLTDGQKKRRQISCKTSRIIRDTAAVGRLSTN
jgi:hypothetical protein